MTHRLADSRYGNIVVMGYTRPGMTGNIERELGVELQHLTEFLQIAVHPVIDIPVLAVSVSVLAPYY